MFFRFNKKKQDGLKAESNAPKPKKLNIFGSVITGKKVLQYAMVAVACGCAIVAGLGLADSKISAVSAMPKGYLAIVIDDFGYNGEGTAEMLALDVPLTCALMPFSDKSAEDAEKIKKSGKEMIVHMPMESLTGKRSWVGSKGIFCTMTDEEIRKAVNEAFAVAEGAVGLNNHMGSAIMEDERCLKAVIDEVNKRGLIFLDSRTTPNSKAKAICGENGTCLLGRDIFLDSTNDIAVVKKQLRSAAKKAIKNGNAIAIGHVGPEGGKITAQAIKELKTELEGMGVEFVTLTQIKGVIDGSEKFGF